MWLTKMHLGCHFLKAALFNIFSLADQLYQSRSINLNVPELGKIYFFENPIPNLLVQSKEAFIKNVLAYNESLSKPSGG